MDGVRSVASTKVKNEFGGILEEVIAGNTVVITKYAAPKAVLMSVEAYEALRGRRRAALEEVEARYDAWLDRMQTPEAQQALRDAFHATPEAMGRAAVKAASAKRGTGGRKGARPRRGVGRTSAS